MITQDKDIFDKKSIVFHRLYWANCILIAANLLNKCLPIEFIEWAKNHIGGG